MKKEIKNFHCRNKKCRVVLGQTDGARFYFIQGGTIGEVMVKRNTILNIVCQKCRRQNHWRPVSLENSTDLI